MNLEREHEGGFLESARNRLIVAAAGLGLVAAGAIAYNSDSDPSVPGLSDEAFATAQPSPDFQDELSVPTTEVGQDPENELDQNISLIESFIFSEERETRLAQEFYSLARLAVEIIETPSYKGEFTASDHDDEGRIESEPVDLPIAGPGLAESRIFTDNGTYQVSTLIERDENGELIPETATFVRVSVFDLPDSSTPADSFDFYAPEQLTDWFGSISGSWSLTHEETTYPNGRGQAPVTNEVAPLSEPQLGLGSEEVVDTWEHDEAIKLASMRVLLQQAGQAAIDESS